MGRNATVQNLEHPDLKEEQKALIEKIKLEKLKKQQS